MAMAADAPEVTAALRSHQRELRQRLSAVAGDGGEIEEGSDAWLLVEALCGAPERGGTMNLIEQIDREQVDKARALRPVPEFQPGDTVRVSLRVVEGERERVQAFEGVCIARKKAGINSNFTLRKISYGEGVERVFPILSPMIDSIKVVRRGKVRRAKLYYLRNLRGKSARIVEKQDRQTAVGE